MAKNEPKSYSNGILNVQNNAQLDASIAVEDSKIEATRANSEPVITALAAHLRKTWSSHYLAKLDIEQRMLKSLRQRRGEYEADIATEIVKSGGSSIYMMVSSNKCRAATSWLRDTLLGAANDKPWTLAPTKIPELSPDDLDTVTKLAAQEALAVEQAIGQPVTTPEAMKEHLENVKDKLRAESINTANKKAGRMEDKMEDQLQEGNFIAELSKCLDDITTFPAAILKGPVIRNKPTIQYVQGPDGQYTVDVKNQLVKEWERVDPFNLYPAPHSSSIDDGDMIERHRMSRNQLFELIGVEGYSEDAIRGALDDYGRNGLHEWLRVDTEKAHAEGKSALAIMQNTGGLIDALQFHGYIQGKLLIEWGMTAAQIPDELKEYPCEIWQIGNWTIKASLNYDPFGRKPYYKASYEEIPGAFWGNSVTDLVRDCQDVCNYAARSLVNNMGIASGPQVYVNVDRLPDGEDVTAMYPWKIWPTKSDPYGSNTPPIEFFQPNSLSGELMSVYERFSVLADEYSGVPRYMSGDTSAGGAGRTASGLSMLMGNAGKAIKAVISNIDSNIISQVIERLYMHNMKYETDPDLKGDVRIIARGAEGLVQKEQAAVRRNEFLGMVGQNQAFQQVLGMEGIAALLREQAKGLGMDADKIVPSEEKVRVQTAVAEKNQMIQQAQQAQIAQQPTDQINFQRDSEGTLTGAAVMPGTGKQNLSNGSPTTANFTPQRGA